ncbi:unnamed protein product, partial [Discosporangium mesarthrocarpum]
KASLRERSRREPFEVRIARPYFHVKPLDQAQLEAWMEYLDFEEAQVQVAMPGGSVATGKVKGEGEVEGEGGGGRGRGRGRGARRGGGWEVEMLYERCLVPCAGYAMMWER